MGCQQKNRPLVRHPINQRAKTRVRNEIRCRSVDAKWAFVKNFQYLRFATWILFTRLLLRRNLKSKTMTTMNHTMMKMRTNECKNIGNIDKVTIVPGTTDLVKVTIKVNNRNGSTTDTIINLTDDADNGEWEKESQVESTSQKRKITFSRKGEQICGQCETYTETGTHGCSAMNGGQCKKNECPRPESNYNCAECDYPYLIPGWLTPCDCSFYVCTPTYETEAECPEC